MAVTSSKHVLDGFAWASNVLTSVCIIFINKVLMAKNTGYGFQYATTLCALHYLACSLSIWVTQHITGGKPIARLPFKDLAVFIVTANLSIVSLNLSLMINSVSFYQIAKLLIIPFVCLVEKFWLKRTFSTSVITSVVIVIVGVAIVTVTDLSVQGSVFGVSIAALSVGTSGMQQIFCRTMQQQHRLSAHELLANTAPVQGWTLLAIGPFLDRYVSGTWVSNYEWSGVAMTVLFLSCACAIFVNLSQFACLGRFSAVSFQVLGHMKTVCVLLGGWAFLGDHITSKQLMGMALAVAGMVLYGFATLPKPRGGESGMTVKAKQSLDEGEVAHLLPSDARADLKVTHSYPVHASAHSGSILKQSKLAEAV
ncbi:hypothetical protein WJX73_001596 [Symbiochloris irregularis]|uniref:Sugar phosphate transporter domain-containing protein n=1 Tax=Symbiochloris irregularis TaxID=706552 RepID=A0AAW1PFH8_9CHLO